MTVRVTQSNQNVSVETEGTQLAVGSAVASSVPTLAAVLAKGNSANSRKISSLADPSSAQDAATKAYVDANSSSSTGGSVAFSHSGTVSAGVGTIRFPFYAAATITGVVMAIGTAPTSQALICDVNKNGSTIFTTQGNRPKINASTNATASAAVPDVTAVLAGDYLTCDIDQVGSGTAGSDLTVVISFQ